mmetsp:Transcript_1631/g.2174  ORF Transcript_1631/g.2174 Transcript_1631/m.2174 type:complete len:567 (+) Transcript_1631:123-1823(+)
MVQPVSEPKLSDSSSFPICYLCLKTITDYRDVPVRDEDALIAVIARMASFPGSRLLSKPPAGARLCRPCYDHLKRAKDENIVSKSQFDRIRVLVFPFWGFGPEPLRPSSPPLCPGFHETQLDPNVRRKFLRNLTSESVRRVENTLMQYTQLNMELQAQIFQQSHHQQVGGEGEREENTDTSSALRQVLSISRAPPSRCQLRQQQQQSSNQFLKNQHSSNLTSDNEQAVIIRTDAIPSSGSSAVSSAQQHSYHQLILQQQQQQQMLNTTTAIMHTYDSSTLSRSDDKKMHDNERTSENEERHHQLSDQVAAAPVAVEQSELQNPSFNELQVTEDNSTSSGIKIVAAKAQTGKRSNQDESSNAGVRSDRRRSTYDADENDDDQQYHQEQRKRRQNSRSIDTRSEDTTTAAAVLGTMAQQTQPAQPLYYPHIYANPSYYTYQQQPPQPYYFAASHPRGSVALGTLHHPSITSFEQRNIHPDIPPRPVYLSTIPPQTNMNLIQQQHPAAGQSPGMFLSPQQTQNIFAVPTAVAGANDNFATRRGDTTVQQPSPLTWQQSHGPSPPRSSSA